MTDPRDGHVDDAEHPDLREQWRARRDEFREELEQHVSHARDQFEHARDQFEEANERIKERTGRDLILAIVIGLLLGGVLVASLVFVKWLFVPIALAVALLGSHEFGRALRGGGRRIDTAPQLLAAAFLVLTAYFAATWVFWIALFVAIAFVTVWRMLAQMIAKDGRTYGDVLSDILASGFVLVYVPFLANAFGFEHISIEEYLIAIGIASLIIPIVEIIKFFQRKYHERQDAKSKVIQ